MLKYRLTHPGLIGALAGMGHSSRILLADGNYPIDTLVSPTATRIYLNLRPGLIGTLDVLEAVLDAVPVEMAQFMFMDDGNAPPIAADYRRLIPALVSFDGLDRSDLYSAATDAKTSVVVATGEQALFANLILTVGYVQPDGTAHY